MPIANLANNDLITEAWVDSVTNGIKVLQVVNFQTGAVATGTTVIPSDDTIPQNTEGNEYMSLTIVPTSAANTLILEIETLSSHSVAGTTTVALFQDATANALAATAAYEGTATGMAAISLTHKMTAGTTSPTTFKIRMGSSGAGTLTFNGAAGARRFGGVAASSITITEIAA